MGESALSRLRTRLDPLYNPPPPPIPPLDLDGGGSDGTNATDQQTREDRGTLGMPAGGGGEGNANGVDSQMVYV